MTDPARMLDDGRGFTSRLALALLDYGDAAAFRWVGHHRSPLLDAVLPKLSRVADHSVLWMAVSAALMATPWRRSHLAARQGLVTVAITSAVANLVAKQLFPRDRPTVQLTTAGEPMVRLPRSGSFPSGHSASAAAYAFSVGAIEPSLALPLAGLAAGVAYSRVYTKVHYPTDVIAGVVFGVLTAAAVRRVAPVSTPDPVRVLDPLPVPQKPRPAGEGVVVVVNPRSGNGRAARLQRDLVRDLPKAEILLTKPGEDLMVTLRAAANRAEVLGICGGDGSVNAAAQVAMERDLPLVVLPGGTFNHFAADLGVPRAADAIQSVQAGTAVRVDVGTITDRDSGHEQIFLNTASLGSYPTFVTTRDRWEPRFGKGLATVLAVFLLRNDKPLEARVDSRPHRLAMMFIGNGRYQPHGFAPGWRPRLDDGLLDVRLLDVTQHFFIPRLLWAVTSGRLGRSRLYTEEAAGSLTIELPGGRTPVATDGEAGPGGGANLRFGVRPSALVVYRPSIGDLW
ncbi:MAG: diacylglycerol kinase family protein [Lapillicoccus sp.]